MAHPSPQQISAWLAGEVDAATRAELDANLSHCAQCKEGLAVLRELTLTPEASSGFEDTHVSGPRPEASTAASPPGDEVQPGFTIGRYVVQRRLGQGAMGLVFSAYDPRLDRHVALKLLRPDLPMVQNRPLRQRMEREAQALARLSNPHVVAVHDLGDFGDALFIAMDLVEGQTLTDWLRTPRSWQDVQRTFLQAGEGLAAAHRAGLVHRDFKPDNVLVGTDGVVRVSDFGVSRRVSSSSRTGGNDEETISGAGTLIGTPTYMSPEQFDGRSADPRSDQFGFCVALFEALCGQRPFSGDTLRALSESVHAGPPARIPSRNTLPRWLEALVLKGLSTQPEARFASMGELLAQLKGPAPAKHSARAISALTVVAVAVLGLLAWRELVRRRDDPCAQIEARVAAAWDEPTRARVTAAVTHEPLPWAKDGAAHVDAVFRRFLSQWAHDSAATCRERDAGANVVARQGCLEERLAGFVTFRDALLVPNEDALRHGISVLGRTLGTSTCAIRPTYFEVPADNTRRADFVRLRDAYFTLRTRAALEMVTVDELAGVRHLQQESSRLGFAQLAAAFRQTEGLVLVTRGDLRAAVTAFDDAAVLAEGAHLDIMVADTRRRLVLLWAEEFDVKHARTLVPAMRAAYQRLGDDPDANFGALSAEASVLLEESHFDEAIAKMEKAISLIEPADSHTVTDEYRVLTLMQTAPITSTPRSPTPARPPSTPGKSWARSTPSTRPTSTPRPRCWRRWGATRRRSRR